MRNSFLALIVGMMLLAAPAARGENREALARAIGDKVMCLCGCVAIVNQCPHQGCSTHDEIQGVIAKMIDEGKSEPEVLQALQARYGTKILAAPPVKGFNIAAWVLPGLGLIFGLVAVVLIVRRLRSRSTSPVGVPSLDVDPKVLAAMEEEMKTTGLGVRE